MEANRPQTVVVVGAGMAAIKLAHTLIKSNTGIKVVMVEAGDYIGGRMKNFTFEGHVFEMGANWVHGKQAKKVNPIWSMAKKVKLQHIECDSDDEENNLVTDFQGQNIKKQFCKLYERLWKVYEKAWDACEHNRVSIHKDTDFRSFLIKHGWKHSNDHVAMAAEWLIIDAEYADVPERLSVAHNLIEDSDFDFGEEEVFVIDQRGYSVILKPMIDELNASPDFSLNLNHLVTKIVYTQSGVKVIAKSTASEEVTEFSGDQVVCTASIGVLLNNLIEFEPVLPPWKLKAIHQYEMAVFCKVFVNFKQKFWKNQRHIITAN